MPDVSYVHSDALIQAADCLPANNDRASLVHSLISALDLVQLSSSSSTDNEASDDNAEQFDGKSTISRAAVIACQPALENELLRFHDASYVNAVLEKEDQSESDDSEENAANKRKAFRREIDEPASKRQRRKDNETSVDFGLHDDCPSFDVMSDYVKLVAGASMTAARALREGEATVSISWTGGRHHAKRDQASGFCYVQDVALAIMELRKAPSKLSKQAKIDRVLYIDLDLHHGDGVEEAFYDTPQVLTLSLHFFAEGFFPSTGALNQTGPAHSKAGHHALNVPLKAGFGDQTLLRLFESCIEPVYEAYTPDAVVVLCGGDGLAGDPCREWNLSLRGYADAVQRILNWKKKTLLLGGGGYNHANVARLWAYLTALALDRKLDLEQAMPPGLSDHHYQQFSPSLTLDVESGARADLNTEEYLRSVEDALSKSVEALKLRYKKT